MTFLKHPNVCRQNTFTGQYVSPGRRPSAIVAVIIAAGIQTDNTCWIAATGLQLHEVYGERTSLRITMSS